MPPELSIDAGWSNLYVDGQWIPSESDEEIAVEDPSTREEDSQNFVRLLHGDEDEIVDLLAHEAGYSRVTGETSIRIASDQAAEAATFPRRMTANRPSRTCVSRSRISSRGRKGTTVPPQLHK